MRRMRRFELRRIAELERKIPHRVAPIDPKEACRRYAAMLAQEREELQNAPPDESLTAVEAMQRYQRMLKSGTSRNGQCAYNGRRCISDHGSSLIGPSGKRGQLKCDEA
jgi:hypothetical protein